MSHFLSVPNRNKCRNFLYKIDNLLKKKYISDWCAMLLLHTVAKMSSRITDIIPKSDILRNHSSKSTKITFFDSIINQYFTKQNYSSSVVTKNRKCWSPLWVGHFASLLISSASSYWLFGESFCVKFQVIFASPKAQLKSYSTFHNEFFGE